MFNVDEEGYTCGEKAALAGEKMPKSKPPFQGAELRTGRQSLFLDRRNKSPPQKHQNMCEKKAGTIFREGRGGIFPDKKEFTMP